MSWSYKSPARRPTQPGRKPSQSYRGDDRDEKASLMIFGMDLPLLAFVAIGGGFVLFGVFWLFFTQWPLPRYCGLSRATRVCGWIQRVPVPPAPATPAVGPPSGLRAT
jgi:hypothetical protein